MTLPTSQDIQEFLIDLYKDVILNQGMDLAAISPDFDFLERGVIDSLGVMEMIAAIEQNFGITVDLEGLDAADLTVLGPLCDYITKTATPTIP